MCMPLNYKIVILLYFCVGWQFSGPIRSKLESVCSDDKFPGSVSVVYIHIQNSVIYNMTAYYT